MQVPEVGGGLLIRLGIALLLLGELLELGLPLLAILAVRFRALNDRRRRRRNRSVSASAS